MQVKIHDAKTRGIGDQLPALDELGPQVLLLILVERLALMLGDVIVSGQEKAPRACCGIADGVVDRRLDQSTMALMSSRGVKYWPAPLGLSAALLESKPS